MLTQYGQKLVEENIHLAYYFAKRYCPLFPDQYRQDVLSECMLGLVHGVHKFDRTRGSLSTIVKICIENNLYRMRRTRFPYAVEVPETWYEDTHIDDLKHELNQLKDVERGLLLDVSGGKTFAEIGRECGRSREAIRRRYRRALYHLRQVYFKE